MGKKIVGQSIPCRFTLSVIFSKFIPLLYIEIGQNIRRTRIFIEQNYCYQAEMTLILSNEYLCDKVCYYTRNNFYIPVVTSGVSSLNFIAFIWLILFSNTSPIVGVVSIFFNSWYPASVSSSFLAAVTFESLPSNFLTFKNRAMVIHDNQNKKNAFWWIVIGVSGCSLD